MMHDGSSMFLVHLLVWGVWLLVIAFGIWIVIALVRKVAGGSGRQRSAREILDERYARGELEPEEYERMRREIREGER